jgi:DNA-binding transcriptional MerR regulator
MSKRDLLAAVGISARQWRAWQRAGLFTPERGPRTRKFTAGDRARLQLLKQLGVGLGLPLERIAPLLRDVPAFDTPPREGPYLNVQTASLVGPLEAGQVLLRLVAGSASPERLADWMQTLALHYFTLLQQLYPTPTTYEAKRDDLLARLRQMDLVARAQEPPPAVAADTDATTGRRRPPFRPSLRDDPAPDAAQLQELVTQRQHRLTPRQHRRHDLAADAGQPGAG